MKVSASVRAVQVPDDNPMHPMFTSLYLIGHDQVLTIDSGETMERYRWMLKGYLAALEKAEIALAGITHHHYDHSGNLKWIKDELSADVVVPKKAVPLLKGRLPREKDTLQAGDSVVELDGGIRVHVLETPGHSTDSVCYYIEEEGVLFSGDTILGTGTTTVHDLKAYRASLKRLQELPNLKVMAPGHGPLIYDPRERIQTYIDHREMRERQILGVLGEGGPMTSWDIMMKLYTDINPRLRRAAENNVLRHLDQLVAEERITAYAGRPRKPSARAAARGQERQVEHERIRKLAEKYEKEDRRREIRAQENPAGSLWVEPPRFEIIGGADE